MLEGWTLPQVLGCLAFGYLVRLMRGHMYRKGILKYRR